jgi:hypothetical protein
MKTIFEKISLHYQNLLSNSESQLRESHHVEKDLQDLQGKLIRESFVLHRINNDLLDIIKSMH